jgi:lysozyme
MRYSKQGLALTEQFEAAGGPKLIAYRPLPTDHWTLGYGHTKGVEGGMTCSPEQAVQWLLDDVQDAENAVNQLVKIGLTQEEFDALVDLTFNIGVEAFKDSTMLRLLNANEIEAASAEFDKWDMSGGKVVAGLLRRREADRALFLLGADLSGETHDLSDTIAPPGETEPAGESQPEVQS